MKRHFVKTSNNEKFLQHIRVAMTSGATEARGVIVHGRPGEGKTACLQNYGCTTNGIFVTGQPDWTVNRMMSCIADRLGLKVDRHLDAKLVQFLSDPQNPIPIIVDEAGFALSNNAICLEKLRSITDQSSSPLVLCFMSQDIRMLDRYKQLSSRIATRCEFEKSTLADVELVFASFSECAVSRELCAVVHEKTDGRMRLIMNSIARIEQFAKVKKIRDREVIVDDVRGVGLFDNFIVRGTK